FLSDINSKWDIANRLSLTTEKIDFLDNNNNNNNTTNINDIKNNTDGKKNMSKSNNNNTSTALTTTQTTRKMNNNKTIISKIVNTTMNQKFTCASKLMPIDMIGIVVNGKVLCCECG